VTRPAAPTTGGLDLPRVTTVQATVKAGRHAWRVARACPDQRRCEHITVVQAATVTPPEDQ
jgi:hypothetical protein